MDVLPAIDLRDGQVVRLERGDYDRQTTYDADPLAVAEGFLADGARWIHVVDLDAARSGELTNTHVLQGICDLAGRSGARVQNGGGIRDRQRIDRLLALGVSRVVIGSAAMKDWDWFVALLDDDSLPGEALALGLDAREGYLAAEGWTEQLDLRADDLAGRVRGSGLGAIVYTDIARDGMLTGINIEATARMVAATDVPVVASGGVASLDDVREARQIGCGGVILGKAMYEKRITLTEALAEADDV